jgi:hypothetical protein
MLLSSVMQMPPDHWVTPPWKAIAMLVWDLACQGVPTDHRPSSLRLDLGWMGWMKKSATAMASGAHSKLLCITPQ